MVNQLKDILNSILKKQLKKSSISESEFLIFKDWERIVGSRISKNCWPVKWISKDTLLIATESSVWLSELKKIENVILEKIKASTQNNKINKLVFRISSPE